MADPDSPFSGVGAAVLVCLAIAGPLSSDYSHLYARSHAAVKLGRSLFPIFALALDLSEDFFEDKVRVDLTCSFVYTFKLSRFGYV